MPLRLAAVVPLISHGPPAGSELEDHVVFSCGEDALEQADVFDRLGVDPVTGRHWSSENTSVKTRERRCVGDAGPAPEKVDDEPRLRIARHRREFVVGS